jgi:hypothetical protein
VKTLLILLLLAAAGGLFYPQRREATTDACTALEKLAASLLQAHTGLTPARGLAAEEAQRMLPGFPPAAACAVAWWVSTLRPNLPAGLAHAG